MPNLQRVRDGAWEACSEQLERLRRPQNLQTERSVAKFFDAFSGFGPKQSRNLIQWLGLTRFVVPIDTRVLNWLNANNFPLPNNRKIILYDEYYDFVEDALQELCRLCDIYPCILDAAVFSNANSTRNTVKN